MKRLSLIAIQIGFVVSSCAPTYYGADTTSYTHQATPSFLWGDRAADGTQCVDSMPSIVNLGQRYASIQFRADSGGHAMIQLLCSDETVLGTLLDTSIAKGFHMVKWYGRDRSDSLLPEGRFRYRVQLPDTVFEDELTLTPPETPLTELLQDYPSPFSAGTVVSFYVHDSAAVVLRMYNVKGEAVRTLIDSAVCARGYHRLAWDGLTDSGNPAPNGIYFSRLAAGSVSLTRKLTLLR